MGKFVSHHVVQGEAGAEEHLVDIAGAFIEAAGIEGAAPARVQEGHVDGGDDGGAIAVEAVEAVLAEVEFVGVAEVVVGIVDRRDSGGTVALDGARAWRAG